MHNYNTRFTPLPRSREVTLSAVILEALEHELRSRGWRGTTATAAQAIGLKTATPAPSQHGGQAHA